MTLPSWIILLLIVLIIAFIFIDWAKSLVIVGFLICNAYLVTDIISFAVLLVISVTLFLNV